MRKEELVSIHELADTNDQIFDHKSLIRRKFAAFEKKVNRNASEKPVGCYMDPKVNDYYNTLVRKTEYQRLTKSKSKTVTSDVGLAQFHRLQKSQGQLDIESRTHNFNKRINEIEKMTSIRNRGLDSKN